MGTKVLEEPTASISWVQDTKSLNPKTHLNNAQKLSASHKKA
jgi:hypothetical protein